MCIFLWAWFLVSHGCEIKSVALECGIALAHGTVDSMDRDAIGPSLFAWFNTRVGDFDRRALNAMRVLTDDRSMQCAS